MGISSYQITADIKDLDNSTVLSSAVVEVFNVGTQERVKNQTGEYTFTPNALGRITADLGNATTDWSNGNIIIVSAYTENGTKKSVDYIFTVDTVTYPDGFDIGNLAVMIGVKLFDEKTNSIWNIMSYKISNSDSSIRYLEFYDRSKGALLLRVYAGVTSTSDGHFTEIGFPFNGGIAKVPSVQGKIYPTIQIS